MILASSCQMLVPITANSLRNSFHVLEAFKAMGVFYTPASKGLEHTVAPLSVRPFVCLSAQTLGEKLNMKT